MVQCKLLLTFWTVSADHPERAALYFVCGVCLGLVLTLIALVVQISCRTDCKTQQAPKKTGKTAESTSDTSDSDSDWDNNSDLSARRHRRFERTLGNVFTSAEELERAQRLEARERIIREIWMNGQPDMPATRSLNRYYWSLWSNEMEGLRKYYTIAIKIFWDTVRDWNMGKANTYNTFWNISSGGTGTSEAFLFLKVHSVHFFVYVALIVVLYLTLYWWHLYWHLEAWMKKQRF